MQLTFLGTGSAFTVGNGNYHSNMLLENGAGRLLIDCGSDVRHALHARNLSYQDITDIYISHLHADHVGGLEWLAFRSKFDNHTPSKPTLHISDLLVDTLWNNVLSGGLQSLRESQANISTYFTLDPIGRNNTFTWSGIKFDLIQTEHIFNGDCLMPSFGLLFKVNGKVCFITTDTQFKKERFLPYYEQADIIFHDCELIDKPSGVHAHYNQLKTLDPAIKGKMWLYHYNPVPLPDAKKDGFCGFVKIGQIFNF